MKQRHSGRNTLQRRLVNTVVAGFVAVVLLNLVVYYYHLNQTKREKLTEFNEYRVTQVRDEFERRMNAAQRDILWLAYSDDAFLDAVRRYDGGFDRRTTIMSKLTGLTAAGHRIDSVYLYLPEYGRVFTTEYGMFFEEDMFYDRAALEILEGASFVRIAAPRELTHRLSRRELVTMAARFPSLENDWIAVLIVNIDIASVYRDLVQQFVAGDHAVVVTDAAGGIMYPRVDESTRSALRSVIEYRPPAFPLVPRYIVSHRSARMYSIHFHVIIDLGTLAGVSGELLRAVRVVLVISTLAVIALLLSMVRAFAPLNALVERVRSEAGTDEPAGDIESLNTYLGTMHESAVELQNRYDEMFPTYRRKFMEDLLMGLVPENASLDEQMEYHHVTLAGTAYAAMCVELLSEGIDDHEFGVFRAFVSSIVTTAVERHYGGFCVEMSRSRFGVALALDTFSNADFDHARICSFAESVVARITDDALRTRVFIGIGRFVSDRLELHQSYEESENVLRYHSLAKKQVVSVYHAQTGRAPYRYPYSAERKLFNLIRSGSPDEAVRTLHMIFADAVEQGFSDYELTHLSSQLLHSLNRYIFDLGIDIPGGHRQTDMMVYEPRRIEETRRYLADLVRHIVDAVAGEALPAGDVVDEILSQISVRYRENTFQLGDLEEQFSLNRYYIGHLIKERTGMYFSDYLNHKRVLAAEELLRETRKPVKEIASDIGYSYPYYFIRMFKKLHGVTPNVYRRTTA